MPRLDRLLTLYFFRFLRKFVSAKYKAVPILMYHSISDAEETVHPYYRVNTVPKVFEEQIRFLAAQGYRTIGLDELNSKDPDGKSVIITFDDGYSDFYSEAFPILQKYDFRATVFLTTAFMGGEYFKGKKCLNWEQVKELHSVGTTFGSHTHTHPQLRNLERSAITQELTLSKNIIQEKLGSKVTAFSYPYRFPEENKKFNRFICKELTNAGYTQVVTTIIGRYKDGDDQMQIKRLPVNSNDDEAFFEAKLLGNYDWLHAPQYIIKRARSIIQ